MNYQGVCSDQCPAPFQKTYFRTIFEHIKCPPIWSILEDQEIKAWGFKTGSFQHSSQYWAFLLEVLAYCSWTNTNNPKEDQVLLSVLSYLIQGNLYTGGRSATAWAVVNQLFYKMFWKTQLLFSIQPWWLSGILNSKFK